MSWQYNDPSSIQSNISNDQSEYINVQTPKGVADLSAAEVNRCLYNVMKEMKDAASLPNTTVKTEITINSVFDWFKFNSAGDVSDAQVNLKGEGIGRKVKIASDKSLVKTTIDINKNGQSSIMGRSKVESYPSLNDKLLKLSKRAPDTPPDKFRKDDFYYPDNPHTPNYDRLIASDLLCIARGQKPQYYTSHANVQFLTEVAVLLFGVENISNRDSSNTQLGANLLLLDMISKKQKYGSKLQHHYRLHNFLDSGKLINGQLFYKKTATYPLYIESSNQSNKDNTNWDNDLELLSLPPTPQNSGNQHRGKNNFAAPLTYTLVSQASHENDLNSDDSQKKSADTFGGMSPSTTGSYTGVNVEIYKEKNNLLTNSNLSGSKVLKDDSNLKDHRVLMKENKILYYWLRQNAPECFSKNFDGTTGKKVRDALVTGLNHIINDTTTIIPLHQAILTGNLFNYDKISREDLISRDFNGRTALHLAIQYKDYAAVEQLLKKYKENQFILNAYDAFGDTPLHLVAKLHNVDLMRLIFSKIELKEKPITLFKMINIFNGNTLLHSCIENGNLQMSEWMINTCKTEFEDEKINLFNIKNKEGDTPLHLAIKLKNKAVTEQIINSIKPDLTVKNNSGDTPLHLAVANNDEALVKFILNTESGKASLNIINNGDKTPLQLAVIKNNPRMMQLLLENGAFVNRNQFNQKNISKDTIHSPLLTAIARRNRDAIHMLLTARATIENDRENTLLHYLAAIKSSKDKRQNELVKIIQDFSKEINVPNKRGNTPLHIAIQRGNYNVAKEFIKGGADVNVLNAKQRTPLHDVLNKMINLQKLQLESESELSSLAKLKDNSPADKQKYTRKLEIIASCQDNLDELNKLAFTLLDKRAKIDIQDKTGSLLFHQICQCASYNVIEKCFEKLLSSGDLKNQQALLQALINRQDFEGNTSLHLAAFFQKDSNIISLLMKSGADKFARNRQGNTPLHLACLSNNFNFITPYFFNMSGPEVAKLINTTNAEGVTPFHIAIAENNLQLVEELIKLGAEIKFPQNGLLPFDYAIQQQNIGLILLLVRYGENVNRLNAHGETLLHRAVIRKDKEYAAALIKLGANANAKNNYGESIVAAAVNSGDYSLLVLLIRNIADVNILYNGVETLLHYAIRNENKALVEELIKAGANIGVKNSNGVTPLELAIERKFSDGIKLLSPPQTLPLGESPNPFSLSGQMQPLTPAAVPVTNPRSLVPSSNISDVNMSTRPPQSSISSGFEYTDNQSTFSSILSNAEPNRSSLSDSSPSLSSGQKENDKIKKQKVTCKEDELKSSRPSDKDDEDDSSRYHKKAPSSSFAASWGQSSHSYSSHHSSSSGKGSGTSGHQQSSDGHQQSSELPTSKDNESRKLNSVELLVGEYQKTCVELERIKRQINTGMVSNVEMQSNINKLEQIKLYIEDDLYMKGIDPKGIKISEEPKPKSSSLGTVHDIQFSEHQLNNNTFHTSKK